MPTTKKLKIGTILECSLPNKEVYYIKVISNKKFEGDIRYGLEFLDGIHKGQYSGMFDFEMDSTIKVLGTDPLGDAFSNMLESMGIKVVTCKSE